MQKPKIFLAISALILASLACNTLMPATESPSSPPTVSADPTSTLAVIVEPTFPGEEPDLPATDAQVPRVSLEQALTAYTAGAAVFVDVRAPQSYEISHIPGAINIPLGAFETDIANVNLEKDAWIITYCTWQNEHTSARAAFLLLQNGYTRVTPILGGFDAWKEAGYPIEP